MTAYSSGKMALKWVVKYFKDQTLALACSGSPENCLVYCSNRRGWIVSLNATNWNKVDSAKMNATVLSIKIIGSEVFCGLADGDLAILSTGLKPVKVGNREPDPPEGPKL